MRTWNREQRALATVQKMALLSVSIDGNGSDKLTGKYDYNAPIEIEKARFMFFCAAALFDGRTVDEAVKKGKAAMKAK